MHGDVEVSNGKRTPRPPDVGHVAHARRRFVRLTGGFAITFGVWLAVHPDDLQRAARVWYEPQYGDLVLAGKLANVLPVWGLCGVPVRAVVRDPEQTPYCADSTNERLTALLSQEWPHEAILDAIANR